MDSNKFISIGGFLIQDKPVRNSASYPPPPPQNDFFFKNSPKNSKTVKNDQIFTNFAGQMCFGPRMALIKKTGIKNLFFHLKMIFFFILPPSPTLNFQKTLVTALIQKVSDGFQQIY